MAIVRKLMQTSPRRLRRVGAPRPTRTRRRFIARPRFPRRFRRRPRTPAMNRMRYTTAKFSAEFSFYRDDVGAPANVRSTLSPLLFTYKDSLFPNRHIDLSQCQPNRQVLYANLYSQARVTGVSVHIYPVSAE